MKKCFLLLLLFFSMLLLAVGDAPNTSNSNNFQLLRNDSLFVAGNPIYIGFVSGTTNAKPKLFINHSYGKTLLDCNYYQKNYIFKIPEIYATKTGTISWHLINNSKTVSSGQFTIAPNDQTKTKLENYLGPRSILAGGSEFTMLVTVPTDKFDNPKSDKTTVFINHQFLDKLTLLELKTEHFITWYNIYSPLKSGKIFISSQCDKTATKEIETKVYPNNATNFQIFFTQDHSYADGNQITSFSTSIIKDKFNNMVSDGTLVSFIIKTKNNSVLKTFGNTINGIARAQILHPNHADIYAVSGYVTGLAQSNTLLLNFKSIINDFDYNFSNNNRTLTVGCLKSYMNQIVPDGVKVSVKVFHNNILINTLTEDTSKGFAVFNFDKAFYTKNNYVFEISTLGLTKKTTIINYEL